MNRKESFLTVLVVFLVLAFGNSPVSSQPLLKTTFIPEPTVPAPANEEPVPPLFLGKVFVQDSLGNWVLGKPLGRALLPISPDRTRIVGNDVYVQDGAETAIGVNYDDGNNLFAGYNLGSVGPEGPRPLSYSTDGNLSWAGSLYPETLLVTAGPGFDPWVNAGNAGGEFFGTLIRYSLSFPIRDSAHTNVFHSANGGANFSLFFEKFGQGFQDKEALDIDKTTARGGGTGSAHDGKLYLGYDDHGAFPNPSYKGGFLQVVSAAGAAETEIQISGTGTPPFRGQFLQPVAGITDGSVYVKGCSFGSSTTTFYFHEITNGGAGPNIFNKSTLSFPQAGQMLGASGRWGVNGFRVHSAIGNNLDIDRSSGPRRGYLYFVSERNPNPSNAALDQGDVYVYKSTNGASSWSSALLPTAAGKTQYYSMTDMDEQGWIHVAYYQNETGSVNGGVLNASTANLYYTVSIDGGTNWTPPVQVNDPANALDFEDPPPNRSARNYYLIGDYAQLAATGTGASTKAYLLWTGYDKDRSDTLVGDTRARVYCTTIQSFPQCQNDVEPPVITCPTDIATQADSGQCTALVSFQTSVTDNCPLGVALTCNPPSGSTFSIGMDTVVCVASDLAGNADTCSFTVAVSVVKGDMNADTLPTSADVVLLLNCTFLGTGNCALCFADVNCDGVLTSSDVVLELNHVFLGLTAPPWCGP